MNKLSGEQEILSWNASFVIHFSVPVHSVSLDKQLSMNDAACPEFLCRSTLKLAPIFPAFRRRSTAASLALLVQLVLRQYPTPAWAQLSGTFEEQWDTDWFQRIPDCYFDSVVTRSHYAAVMDHYQALTPYICLHLRQLICHLTDNHNTASRIVRTEHCTLSAN